MRPTRRKLLTAAGAALTGAVAGCSSGDEETTATGTATGTPTGGQTQDGASMSASVETAVAAEWNAMRARIWDAHAAGLAGATDAGGSVAQSTFARFENAGGEYGAHEMLESTSEQSYEGFEEALGALREGLEAGDMEAAGEAANSASTHLSNAQWSLLSGAAAELFELQLLGATAQNAGFLAASDNLDAAGTVASNVASRFESSPVYDSLESAEGDAYDRFESALSSASSAADSGDAAAVQSAADDAFSAAIDGSYALAGDEIVAGTGHMATLQARGRDAATVGSMGGPSTDYAHAAALTIYRERAYDCHWLAARGETEQAATMAGDIFAHFEGANAHEALESADEAAYESFETGLSELKTAIENGNSSAVDSAVETVDSSLVTGVEALAGADAPLLEAAFFRARFADAYELYQLGESDVAATVAESLFQRFEQNELDFHETVEDTNEQLYTSFEEEHLSGLIDAFENANDGDVETHYEGVNSTLLSFETEAGTAATVSGAEGAYMTARGFDAAAVDALGEDSRAQAIAQSAFQHFEGGAGGFHEALEDADESVYESFETELGAIGTAAGDGDAVYPASKSFNAEALSAIYAVVGAGGGTQGAAAAVMQDVFAHFEAARVHELIEDADHNAYETFEGGLDAYITTLEDGGDIEAAADTFADGAQYAEFALVDSVESLPLDLDLAGGAGGASEGGESGGESDLAGGPNVADGSPSDADHVVDMNAVAFEPADLTVSQGDTVAWVHSAGEPHSVTAYGEEIPDGATYWASGGFDSEDAARSGWENGEGAVQSGQYYTHTFETTGTHQYCCIPHEAAGMTGSVTVE
ncbi:DUF5059 domain-containing protein [Haloarcula laminariae]|uniref:DUF5059 domain-containing protein n=1 Tax=Haloarcula laminariae TaxID=2961577 RepID=UPI0024058EE7|nr:DUF5059 domain-containing protein [Halomicroarcula sp. FL173]